jgi:hypothetical protein
MSWFRTGPSRKQRHKLVPHRSSPFSRQTLAEAKEKAPSPQKPPKTKPDSQN